MTDYLQLEHVNKTFLGFKLDDITLHLPKGYIMGLVGPNGSGKTTIIKLILNILEKDTGEISLFGNDIRSREMKQQLGVVFDSNCYVDSWNLRDVEKAVSMFYEEWDSQMFYKITEHFQLPKRTKLEKFSRGMQMKLMLASAFSHNAKLLVLDEPNSGLDPAARNELSELLQDYISDGEKSVLFSTHITNDLEKTADYLTYLSMGKLIYTGSTEQFLQNYYLIKGAPDELTPDLKKHVVGLRETMMGFEGLITAGDSVQYKGYLLDAPSIDDIIICYDREEKMR